MVPTLAFKLDTLPGLSTVNAMTIFGTARPPVSTSGSERVADTARRFVEGFFGYYFSAAVINIVPEVTSQRAHSLVPLCNNASIPEETESACSSKVTLHLLTRLQESETSL